MIGSLDVLHFELQLGNLVRVLVDLAEDALQLLRPLLNVRDLRFL